MINNDEVANWLEECTQVLEESAQTKSEIETLVEQCAKTDTQIQLIQANFDELINESLRVASVLHNARATLDEIDREFERRTQLTGRDKAFLFVATALQVVRQYFVSYFPQRLDDQTAAKQTSGHGQEHSDRSHRYYNPSLEQVIANPVPFDAIIGSDGALSGGGKLGHRATAIGHDPLAGLFVGTANIATSTLTTSLANNFKSYHITTVGSRDAFRNQANTFKVFQHTGSKLLFEGLEGKQIVGASLMKEVVHLRSDINSKNSLPLPLVSTINPSLAADLAKYGLDMGNVTTVLKQATLATLINTLIAMIHRMFYDSAVDGSTKLYEVRTRKILDYSNIMASASNIIYVVGSTFMGDATAVRKLDIGGFFVTLYRLFTDISYIGALKREFIAESFNEKIRGDFDYSKYGIVSA